MKMVYTPLHLNVTQSYQHDSHEATTIKDSGREPGVWEKAHWLLIKLLAFIIRLQFSLDI
jgi:hypothetical protein